MCLDGIKEHLILLASVLANTPENSHFFLRVKLQENSSLIFFFMLGVRTCMTPALSILGSGYKERQTFSPGMVYTPLAPALARKARA